MNLIVTEPVRVAVYRHTLDGNTSIVNVTPSRENARDLARLDLQDRRRDLRHESVSHYSVCRANDQKQVEVIAVRSE